MTKMLRMTEEQLRSVRKSVSHRTKHPGVNIDRAHKRTKELQTRATEREAREKWERLFLFQLTSSGFPEPQCQYKFSSKRQFRLDIAYAELNLGIEVEGGIWRKGGGAHSHPSNIERDIEKHNLLALEGWALLRVTPRMIQSGEALKLVEDWMKKGAE